MDILVQIQVAALNFIFLFSCGNSSIGRVLFNSRRVVVGSNPSSRSIFKDFSEIKTNMETIDYRSDR
jgi:hypothetical protein